MGRFIWINTEEDYNKHLGMLTNIYGKEYSGYDIEDEGLIYDTIDKCIVLDFGNDQGHDSRCGTKPNDKYLAVIMTALNEIK